MLFREGKGGEDLAQMIRKQVYIEPRQDETIKERAKMLRITEAEVIRDAIDGQMGAVPTYVRDLNAWDREMAFIAKRVSVRSRSARRRFRREAIYEEKLNRYGR
jgi:hypothetical protein